MPGFDGTGPQGRGPMTGGARGYCVVGWNGVRRGGLGLRRYAGRGFYGGGRWRDRGPAFWDRGPAYADAPMGDVDGLVEQIERLSERVEALSARLDAKERSTE
jgi:hypothetical protein